MHRFDLRALPFNRQTKFIFNDFNFFSMAHSVYIHTNIECFMYVCGGLFVVVDPS